MASLAPASMRAASLEAPGPSTGNGSAALAGTGLDSVKPFCHSCDTCTAAKGVTENQPQACFHPTSMRPLRRLLPKLPLAVSVGPMPTMLRVSLLRKVEKLSAAAAYSEAQ